MKAKADRMKKDSTKSKNKNIDEEGIMKRMKNVMADSPVGSKQIK